MKTRGHHTVLVQFFTISPAPLSMATQRTLNLYVRKKINVTSEFSDVQDLRNDIHIMLEKYSNFRSPFTPYLYVPQFASYAGTTGVKNAFSDLGTTSIDTHIVFYKVFDPFPPSLKALILKLKGSKTQCLIHPLHCFYWRAIKKPTSEVFPKTEHNFTSVVSEGCGHGGRKFTANKTILGYRKGAYAD